MNRNTFDNSNIVYTNRNASSNALRSPLRNNTNRGHSNRRSSSSSSTLSF